MMIELELPSILEENGADELSKPAIACIWNTIVACVLIGDIDNVEYLMNASRNIAEENLKVCKRKLGKW